MSESNVSRVVVKHPIAVDLDDSLVFTDTLVESVLLLIKQNPLFLFRIALWLMLGKAGFKVAVAKHVELDATLLPYNKELIDYLTEQKQAGRSIVLATAAHHSIAKQVAEHLGIFDKVLASDSAVNLSGVKKHAAISDYFGGDGYVYVGDHKKDLAIWQQNVGAIVITRSKKFVATVTSLTKVEYSVLRKPISLGTIVKAVRLHQWVKNLLIFVPLVMAHLIFDLELLTNALAAFFAFGFTASGTYIFNDLLDLQADRSHPSKCRRPLAAGDLPLLYGAALVPILWISGMWIALSISSGLAVLIGGYLILNFGYTLYLKRIVLIDVLLLACLYTWRIIVGGVATDVPLSPWLLAFSVFIFFSLALLKRTSELIELSKSGSLVAAGRGYQMSDMEQLANFGSSSGYIAVLVLALYINSDKVSSMYPLPAALWLLCPVLLYWISRIWLIGSRGKMHSDPIVFAIKDPVSYLVVTTMLMIMWVSANG